MWLDLPKMTRPLESRASGFGDLSGEANESTKVQNSQIQGTPRATNIFSSCR